MPKIELIQGDCLEKMKDIPDKSIDMILCDLPYGTTACKWDTVIPFEPLWDQYKRIIKDNGAIVLTASQPFTSALVMSNIKMFKYEWIWEKSRTANFMMAKYVPLKITENIVVFSKGGINQNTKNKMFYIPQGVKQINKEITGKVKEVGMNIYNRLNKKYIQTQTNYPTNVIKIPNEKITLHPTQKPVALFEYLIKTYTSVGDTILDNCIGSGTTAVAAINTGRNWIGIEKDENYCKIAEERIKNIPTKLI